MRIRFHNINNKVVLVLKNIGDKTTFNNLEYSFSLDGLGSCSFNVLPQDGDDITSLINGLEYVYIENEDEDIVWGGVFVSFDNTVNTLKFNCIDMRWALSLVILDANLEISGNALDSVIGLLAIAKSKRDFPLSIDTDNSEVLDNANIVFRLGKDIHSCIADLVKASESRWTIKYTKSGNDVIGKIVMRSISGVSPEGAGLNRTVASGETSTNEKVLLRYIENSPQNNNILNYRLSYDMRGMVSNPKLSTKIGGIPTIFEPDGDSLSSLLIPTFGKTEKLISNLEVEDADTAQVLANKEVSFPPFNPTITLDQSVADIINVGDRISLYLKTNLLTVGIFTESGTVESIIPIGVRVEEKSVRIRDGYKQIILEVMGGGANKLNGSFTEQFSVLKKQVDPLVRESTQGHTHVEADIVDLDKYSQAYIDSLHP